MKRLFSALLAALILWAAPARAHPMQESQVLVRVLPDHLRLHIVVPSQELAYALIEAGKLDRPPPGFAQYPVPGPAMVGAYLATHLAATSPDGTRWAVVQRSLRAPPPGLVDGAPDKDWIADVDLIAPDHRLHGPVRLSYGIVTREVFSHIAMVSLEEDWQAGVLPQAPRVLGQISRGEQGLQIVPGAGDAWRSWLAMIVLGMQHIAEGLDHQAFLVTVLLTVGLVATGRRWQVARGVSPVLKDTLWRVSAFTLGHSVSLLATSLGWLPPGGQGIEILIAVSVGLSAVHALVPLYPGREGWITAGFGLIHGMAFATAIRDMDLPTGQIVAATLGFNIGIELAQLALVAVLLPLILLARRWPGAERVLRSGGAAVCLGAALWWIAQRV